MNLLAKRWFIKGNAKVKYENGKMIIKNEGDSHSLIVYPKIFKKKINSNTKIMFEGNVSQGTAGTLKMINRHRQTINAFNLNSVNYVENEYYKYYLFVIYVPENSCFEITKLKMKYETNEEYDFSDLNGDILVVTPGYPTLDNKYNCGFVHTRVKEYKKLNWNVDVLNIGYFKYTAKYSYEGVKVTRGSYFFLRSLLQQKHYDKILIHFFNDDYANVLESVDLTNTKLYFYLHGAETLYWDWEKIASPYFDAPAKINDDLRRIFCLKDYYIKKYNEIENAKWVFVTPWTRKRCEELLNIKFNNSDVVPCLVDSQLFSYQEKDDELRKKIFVLRKFDDINSYSLDTCVRVILELSRRKIFQDLEFDIYGMGSLHDRILLPLEKFDNVHIHNRFLNHEEIKEVHRTHGIALFPTRFDSQAVSSCEAASSGCAVITSDIPGTRQMFPDNMGILCDSEKYFEYADVIERMYNDPAYFHEVRKAESKSIQSKYDYKHTIEKEIEMYKEDDKNSIKMNIEISDPILSVIIPSYNVENYLKHTVYSLLDQKNRDKIEIIIVNDGSKDNTINIAKQLEKQYSSDKKSLIKIVDKENGGHGSTINVGIEKAKGKYVKIVDGDDTVDSERFADLIDILEHEDSDIVLNNYIEDFAKDNYAHVMKIYNHLKPGIKYKFDDLCYEDYGFTSWGPILSCSSYKTEMLRQAGFKLSHKMFYVDMELNINVAVACDTITYYDLDIYRYFLGRAGQSVAKESYKRNYKHHENVCINMINVYYKNLDIISDNKKQYIVNKLIRPMLSTQYQICINYMNNGKPFREFEKRLKEYPEFYNKKEILIRNVKFHRRTNGIFIKFNDLLMAIAAKFRR